MHTMVSELRPTSRAQLVRFVKIGTQDMQDVINVYMGI